jgi:hypothetical protein
MAASKEKIILSYIFTVLYDGGPNKAYIPGR